MYQKLLDQINRDLQNAFARDQKRVMLSDLKEFLKDRDLVTLFTNPWGVSYVFPVDIDKLIAKGNNDSYAIVLESGPGKMVSMPHVLLVGTSDRSW